jgi:tetratricopeptide (TPR) repeat protein
MALSFRDLVDRRVPQYLAVYLGAGWGLIEFFSFLEERFSLSPDWTNIVLFAWAMLIPSVILFTYFHGRPGRDRLTRPVLVGVPLNLVIALFVLSSAFGGADLSATTTTVTVVDETGTEVERRIANAAYRKRIALFSFDTAPADTAVSWLGEGAMMALGTDLAQDLFLDFRVPAHFREQLSEAGVADGRNVPLTLKRDIAEELHLPYFLTGSVASGIEGITVRVELYETSTGSLVRERVSTSHDVLRAIDELSVQIKSDLGLPLARPSGVQDLPVAELLSEQPGAFRALVEGQNAAIRNDWASAALNFDRAVALDSTFAQAHYALYQTRLLAGDAQGSTPALDAAMRHLYRMPERTQFIVKADHYFMRQDMDKAFAVVNMMVDLYPDDLQGHGMRAQFQGMRNDREGAIETLRRILELDPQQHEVLLRIGALQNELGRFDDAIATFEAYAAAFPNDAVAWLRVARAQKRVGELVRAREVVDRALVLEPTHVEATLERAILHRDAGELEKADRLLDEAAGFARTAEDRARVASARQTYFESRGQTAKTLEAMRTRLAAVAEYQAPMQQVSTRMGQLGMYVRAGRTEQAMAQLDNVRRTLNAPLDDYWHIGQLEIATATRDTATIIEAMAGVKRVMEQFNFNFLAGNLARGDATLLEERGDWSAALAAWERYQRNDLNQVTASRDIARALRHLGRYDDAQRAIDEHLRSVPFAPESNVEAARIRLADGDTAAARTHLERAAHMLDQADPDQPLAIEVVRLLAALNGAAATPDR